MTAGKDKVFISYRRSASRYFAYHIYNELTERGFDVFFDTQSINAGDFERIILSQIEARGHFIAVMAPGTMPRLENEGDWVRKEMEYALEKKRNIIPLIHAGFDWGKDGKFLTGKLEAIKGINGLTIHDDYIEEGIERLATRFLKEPVYGEVTTVSEEVEAETRTIIESAQRTPKPTQGDISAESYFNQAVQTVFRKKKAIELYSKAIELNPEFGWAYNNRGYLLFKTGKHEEALDDLLHAVEFGLDEEPLAYLNLSQVYMALEDFGHTISAANRAIELDPNDKWGYNNRAMGYYNLENYDQALKDLNQAIEMDPEAMNLKINVNLGIVEGMIENLE